MNHIYTASYVEGTTLTRVLCGADYIRSHRYHTVAMLRIKHQQRTGPWCQKCLDAPDLPLLELADTEL